jgi:hypothetical protein
MLPAPMEFDMPGAVEVVCADDDEPLFELQAAPATTIDPIRAPVMRDLASARLSNRCIVASIRLGTGSPYYDRGADRIARRAAPFDPSHSRDRSVVHRFMDQCVHGARWSTGNGVVANLDEGAS